MSRRKVKSVVSAQAESVSAEPVAEPAVYDGYERVSTPKEPLLELFRNADGDQLAAVPTCPFCENEPVHLLEHYEQGWYVYRICTPCYKLLRDGKYDRKAVNQKIWWPVERAKRESGAKRTSKLAEAEAKIAALEEQLALLVALNS